MSDHGGASPAPEMPGRAVALLSAALALVPPTATADGARGPVREPRRGPPRGHRRGISSPSSATWGSCAPSQRERRRRPVRRDDARPARSSTPRCTAEASIPLARARGAAHGPAVDDRPRAADPAHGRPDERRPAPRPRHRTRRRSSAGPCSSRSQRNGERMQRLVGDILELSRFRSGSVSLQLRRFSAAALADSAIAVVAPLVAHRGQRIERDRVARTATTRSTAIIAGSSRRSSTSCPMPSATRRTAGTITRAGAHAGRRHGVERDRRRAGDLREPTRPGCSSGSSSAATTATAPARASDWGCRRRSRSPRPTAARSRSESELGRGSTFTLVVPTGGPADEP